MEFSPLLFFVRWVAIPAKGMYIANILYLMIILFFPDVNCMMFFNYYLIMSQGCKDG